MLRLGQGTRLTPASADRGCFRATLVSPCYFEALCCPRRLSLFVRLRNRGVEKGDGSASS